MTNHIRTEIVQVAVIANSRGEILMLRRPESKWQFPGGRLNAGESWVGGLRREVLEETGIADFRIVNVMAVDNWIWEGIPQFGVHYFCTSASDRVRLSFEHDRYKWMTSTDDPAELVYFHWTLRVLLERGLRGDTDYRELPHEPPCDWQE